MVPHLHRSCVGWQRSDRTERGQNVKDRRNDERSDDCQREVLAGVLGLLASGRYRVEADIGKEDDRRGGNNPIKPGRRERREVVGVDRRSGRDDEEHQHHQLDDHHDKVGLRTLLARR